MRPETTRQFCCFVDACNRVDSVADLRTLIRTELREVFSHEMAVCGIGELSPFRIVRLINVDFPSAYLQKAIRPDQTFTNPAFNSWTSKQAPALVHIDDNVAHICHQAAQTTDNCRIKNVASYGVIDGSATTFSYFAFGNVHASAIAEYRELLFATVPHLHVSLIRVLTRNYLREVYGHVPPVSDTNRNAFKANGKDTLRLTEREKQVLRFICTGKSNREIGKFLSISEFTVKTHVKNLLGKLSATTRTEAATKAMNAGLLGDIGSVSRLD